MPVVAVVNRKGGSGKSTLSTHLAAYCAHRGIAVMLGDVDRQQSTQTWLKLRSQQAVKSPAEIVGWTVDARSVLRCPVGVNHVVLDTPGGLTGFDLARVAMFADAILMPVCNSVFDRESAADCYAELMTMPRVASGRCKVAAVGMRVDSRSKSEAMLRAWAERQRIPFLGVLRESARYVRSVEQGLTLFDSPPARVSADLAQWQPILQWLHPVLHPPPASSPLVRPVDLPADTPRAVSAVTSVATPSPISPATTATDPTGAPAPARPGSVADTPLPAPSPSPTGVRPARALTSADLLPRTLGVTLPSTQRVPLGARIGQWWSQWGLARRLPR